MKFKKILSAALVVVMSVSVFTGCNKTETPTGETPTEVVDGEAPVTNEGGKKILRLNNNSDPGTLNPSMAEGSHDSWVIDHCFEGIFRKSPEGGIENGLAESYVMSDDVKTLTITLKDTNWSNGEPVTAHDFEFTYKNVLDPETASKYAYYMYVISGGEEYNMGTGTRDDVKVKALDDETLEIVFKAPLPYFTDYMSHYTFYPTNKAIVEASKASGEDWSTNPETYICNGPFKLTEWKNKDSIKIVKNEEYFEKDKIKLDGVDFVIWEDYTTAWNAYQNDELDFVYPLPADVVGELVKTNDPELAIAEDLSTYYYILNTTKAPFNNIKVRKALAMTMDRKVITENILQGGQTPAYGLTCPGIADYSMEGDFQGNIGDLFVEDYEAAKVLLEEGLVEEGMTLADFDFTLLYNTSEVHKSIAEAAQNMWKQNLGVTATLENQEFQVVIDRRHEADFDVVRAGWIGDYADPMTFLDMFVTGGEQNSGLYSNAKYDALIKEAQNIGDQQKRFELMKEAEVLLIEEMAIIPLYFYTKPFVAKPRVTGLYTPVNRYTQYTYADLVDAE